MQESEESIPESRTEPSKPFSRYLRPKTPFNLCVRNLTNHTLHTTVAFAHPPSILAPSAHLKQTPPPLPLPLPPPLPLPQRPFLPSTHQPLLPLLQLPKTLHLLEHMLE